MTVPKKPASKLPYPQVGDLISLPNAQTDTMCLVVMDDYKSDGQVNGVYYLPVRILSRQGRNVPGQFYHFSKRDLEEIKAATKKNEFRLPVGDGKPPFKHFRLEYELKHYAFDEDKLPEIFFIKYARTQGTHVLHAAIQQVNKKLLAESGISLEIEETNRPLLKRKEAPSARETKRPSKGVSTKYVDDLSLDDALAVNYICKRSYNALSKLSAPDGGKLTLRNAYEIVTRQQAGLSSTFRKVSETVAEDISIGWKEFAVQIKDRANYDFGDIVTRYPEKNLT